MYSFGLTIFFSIWLLSVYKSDRLERPLYAMVAVTSTYYCVASPVYWSWYHNFRFLGVYWGDVIYDSLAWVLLWNAFFIIGFFFFMNLEKLRNNNLEKSFLVGKYSDWQTTDSVFLYFGIALSFFVWVMSIASGGGFSRGGVLLIAYQISDVSIPFILLLLAVRGVSYVTISMIILFCIYAASIGFRYKLLLLLGPLALWWFGMSKSRLVFRIGVLGGVTIAVGLIFSGLTLVRQKFSGIDFNAAENAGFDELMYSIFAESNVGFGEVGVDAYLRSGGELLFLIPVLDSIVDFVPRFIYSDKSVGEYLAIPLIELIADNALDSGTAYTMAGEFALMFGRFFSLGVAFALGYIVSRFFIIGIRVYRINNSVGCMFTSIASVYFGYYFLSRGYLPQMSKTFIFMMVPLYYSIARKIGV